MWLSSYQGVVCDIVSFPAYIYMYIPCCIYNAQIIKSTHFKWLAKAFSYLVTHIFRLYNFHLLGL